jgi:cysteine synthase A
MHALYQPAWHQPVDPFGGGILAAVGRTPLVRLDHLYDHLPVRLFAKLEFLNPGGSVKDRPARAVIEQGIGTGEITADTTVVESSSGNMGIGMAQICSYYGLKFLCVVDTKTTRQNIQLLRAYGAEVEVIEQPDPQTGEFLAIRLARVRQILAERPNTFWPNQYINACNPRSHHHTAAEIIESLDGCVDWVILSVGTCGTLRGCAEYFRRRSSKTRILAVDAEGSLIFGHSLKKRLIPGHGASVPPPLFEPGLSDEHVAVSDLDCVVGCRRLARREAILAGGSSGGVVTALERIPVARIRGTTCVMILHDRGERYLDTIYSNEWVQSHFGDVSTLWEQ